MNKQITTKLEDRRPIAVAVIESTKKRLPKAKEAIEILKINSDKANKEATLYLQGIKKMYKELDNERKEIIKPIDESKKVVQGKYKPMLNELIRLEGDIKTKMIAWNRIIEKRERERLAKIEAENQKKLIEFEKESDEVVDAEFIEMPVLKDTKQKDKSAPGQTFVKIKKWKIVDYNKIPRQYLIVDNVLINQTMKQNIEIPGIVYYEEKSVTIRN